MENKEVVSIVIPIYNVEAYLEAVFGNDSESDLSKP